MKPEIYDGLVASLNGRANEEVKSLMGSADENEPDALIFNWKMLETKLSD
jgi:hypothetical protein